MDYNDLKNIISSLANKDIKNVRNINHKFIEFLRDGYIFNISVILKEIDILKNKEDVVALLKGIRTEISNNLPQTNYTKKLIKKLNKLINDALSNGFNVKLMRNTFITTLLVSYFVLRLLLQCNASLVTWCSDRDNMTTANDNFIKDLFGIMTKSFCHVCDKNDNFGRNLKLCFGIQKEDLWMDEIIRIPDYIAGSFADYNYKENKCREKFLPLIENFATKNNYFHCFEFGIITNENKIHNKTLSFILKDRTN